MMSVEHFFGLHDGHIDDKRADAIAKPHGAWHVNYTEPGTGRKRGWFACHNRGAPFDQRTAAAVMADIGAAGGIDALREHPRHDGRAMPGKYAREVLAWSLREGQT